MRRAGTFLKLNKTSNLLRNEPSKNKTAQLRPQDVIMSRFARSLTLETPFMRAVLQRVAQASVIVEDQTVGEIGPGWLVLLGVARGDSDSDAAWLADKLLNLRAFEDGDGKMNRSVVDCGGGILVVSQFTLLADCHGGRRPSFSAAAEPAAAERLYQRFVELLRPSGLPIATGVFGAMMKVALVNDGPVTLLLDSQKPA
jgi:D-tyrosyl-tRNA(Tyr) deacylase